MRTIATVAVAALIAATSLTTTVTPADAGGKHWNKHQYNGQHMYGGGHVKKHRGHRRHRSHGWNPGAALATGAILGLAFGALATPTYYYPPQYPAYHPYPVGPQANAQHVSWCFANYRSYNINTNTWRGYDGLIHRCNSPY